MIILVLNCGSSSIKYQVLDMKSEQDYLLLAKGIVERIGMEMAVFKHQVSGRAKQVIETPVSDHTEGIKQVLDLLVSAESGVLTSLEDIQAVGHRVAHGGEFFHASALIDEQAEKNIEACCALAPLHNPANLMGIRAMKTLLPKLPQVAVFDTSFHQTIPDYAFMYAIPYKYYTQYKVRRYGFHGTSHKFVAQKGCAMLGLDFNASRIVTCHLGNGGSVAAILNGKSIDTSMGFTPIEGMLMGTRCGDIDAGVVTFLQEKEGLDAAGINAVLNKESGAIGVSGISSDMRDIEVANENGNKRAGLTLNMFFYRVLKYIGAYTAAMKGVDLIVFTGGIGENDPDLRAYIGEHLAFLGVDFNPASNKGVRGKDVELTHPGSKVKIAVLTTDEELVIATDTMHLIKQ
ncbi:MAG: acetate kinase [Bacteroidales bacterium]|nr:acetate kinase [Bacteroidales bacterium]